MIKLLCVLLLVVAAQAAPPLDVTVEKDADHTMWGALLDAAGLKENLPDSTVATMFAPTNRAVTRFLADMNGMSMKELLERPQLVDAILAYHTVPGAMITASAKGRALISTNPAEPTFLATAMVGEFIKAHRSNATGFTLLQDVQGNLATVVDAKPLVTAKVAIWGISAVLFSKSYYKTGNDALRAFPNALSTAFELKQHAVMAGGDLAQRWTGGAAATYIVPSNAALAKDARALAAADPKEVARIFRYNTLPGVRSIPQGFPDDGKVDTFLPGATLTTKITYTAGKDALSGEEVDVPSLTLTDANGNSAKVVLANIFAGKSVIQGVDALLTPGKAMAARAADTGRKLLQRSRGGGRGVGSQWSAQRTSAAIRAAARGDAPVGWATAVGSRNARAAGCPNCARWNMIF